MRGEKVSELVKMQRKARSTRSTLVSLCEDKLGDRKRVLFCWHFQAVQTCSNFVALKWLEQTDSSINSNKQLSSWLKKNQQLPWPVDQNTLPWSRVTRGMYCRPSRMASASAQLLDQCLDAARNTRSFSYLRFASSRKETRGATGGPRIKMNKDGKLKSFDGSW